MGKYSDISLSWYGDVTSIAGNAQHARALLKPLIEGGAYVQLIPIKTSMPAIDLGKWWEAKLQECSRNSPGMVMVNHTRPGIIKKNNIGGPTILFTHWETFAVPTMWRREINSDAYEEVWLPNKSIYEAAVSMKSIDKQVYIVNYPINLKEYDTNVGKTSIMGIDTEDKNTAFIFGSTGVWNNRRNLSDLIIAFCSEFSEIDSVALVLKTNSNNYNDPNERIKITNLVKDIKKQLNRPKMPPVVVLQDVFNQDTMNSILARFDAYISTSRGENKSIAMMRCMAMGKACVYMPIHTNRDLNRCEGGRMYPYKFCSEPVTQMGQYYSALDYWARPDLGDLARKMRAVYTDASTEFNSTSIDNMREFLAANYNVDHIVDDLADHIRDISPTLVKEIVVPTADSD